jgi:hypothetical protein
MPFQVCIILGRHTFDAAWIFTQAPEMILNTSPTAHNQAWRNSQSFSTPASRYQAYLNQLCLSAVLPWLWEDYAPQAKF